MLCRARGVSAIVSISTQGSAVEGTACHSTNGPGWSGSSEPAVWSARRVLNACAGAIESKTSIDRSSSRRL